MLSRKQRKAAGMAPAAPAPAPAPVETALEIVVSAETTEPSSAGGPEAVKRPRVSLPQSSTGLPRGKLRFRPNREYQEVLEDHCLPAGLTIKMDVSTGKNLACLGEGQAIDYAGAKDNYGAVGDAIRAAVTWDKPDRVASLVKTCFYDGATLLPALLEASGKGHTDCVLVERFDIEPFSDFAAK